MVKTRKAATASAKSSNKKQLDYKNTEQTAVLSVKINENKCVSPTVKVFKNLRSKTIVNYVESPLNKTLERNVTHVPVYKQLKDKKNTNLKDPYEFVDEGLVKSKKVRESDLSFKCNVKTTKKVNPKKKLVVNNTHKVKYDDKIETCLKKIKAKINLNQTGSTTNSKNKTSLNAFAGEVRATNLMNKFSEENTDCQVNESNEDSLNNNSSCFDTPEKSNENTVSSNEICVIEDVIDEFLSKTDNAKPFRLEGIERNPHFINLKSNAMPSLNQELVLDATFDENIAKVNKTTSLPKMKNSPVQQKLTDYIENEKENISGTINSISNYSLYDADALSPLKSRNCSNQSNKESRVKRKIFGMVQHTSTPMQPKRAKIDNPNISAIAEETLPEFSAYKELSSPKEKTAKRPEEMPFRLNSIIHRVYTKKRYNNLPEENNEDNHEHEFNTNDENVDNNARLFDDVDQSDDDFENPEKLNDLKIRKRKRIYSTEESHKPKKKRDLRTAVEIKAAEEWIKKFNSMCEEVDQTVLEVE